jgi:hypothetical protein
LDLVLELSCRKVPHGGDHETRRYAEHLIEAALSGKTEQADLDMIAREALLELDSGEIGKLAIERSWFGTFTEIAELRTRTTCPSELRSVRCMRFFALGFPDFGPATDSGVMEHERQNDIGPQEQAR